MYTQRFVRTFLHKSKRQGACYGKGSGTCLVVIYVGAKLWKPNQIKVAQKIGFRSVNLTIFVCIAGKHTAPQSVVSENIGRLTRPYIRQI